MLSVHEDRFHRQDVEAILRRIEECGLHNDSRVLPQVNLALRSGDWSSVIRIIAMLRTQRTETLSHPFDDLPPPETVAGEILVGYVVNPDWSLGHPVFLKLEHFDRHVVNVGAPGTGKSVTNRSLALQLESCGVHFLFLDSEDEAWDLPAYAPPGNIVRCTIKDGQFKRNPFQPLPLETFINVDARMRDIDREIWLADGGVNLGTEVGVEMFEKRGVFTVREFYEELLHRRKSMTRAVDIRRAQYLEGLVNRFTGLVMHLAGTYDCIEGFPFEELAARSWVFNLQGMASDTRVFFPIELLAAFDDFKASLSENTFRNVVFVEEGHRYIKSAGHADTILGEPLLFDTVRTGRKRMMGVITTTQEAKDLPPVISGNSATHLYYVTTDGDSIKRIATDHSLTPEQSRLFPELPPRFAVMRHPEFPKPFLVRMPDVEFGIPVTRNQVSEMMAPILASLKWTPAPSEETNQATRRNDGGKRNEANGTVTSNDESHEARNGGRYNANASAPANAGKEILPAVLLDYLRVIANDQLMPTAERYQAQGLSAGKGDALTSQLVQRKLVEKVKVPTGRKGGQITLLEITSTGREMLERFGVKVNLPGGKGGLRHQYFQNKIAEWVRANHPDAKAVIEDASSGKAVDVSFVQSGKRIAIEVLVNGIDKEMSNVEKDSDYDEVWLVAETQEQLTRLKEKVEAAFDAEQRAKLRFEHIAAFLKET